MRFCVLIIAACCCSVGLFAQTDGGNGNVTPESFDVVKVYEPVLADAIKVSFSPDLPSYEELQKNKPSFKDYYVPTRLMNISYDPPALKPLKYDDSKNKKPATDSESNYHFWLRGGFGNLVTPLIDVSASNGKSERFSIGADAFYNSSRGNIDFQDMRRLGAKVYGKAFLGAATLGMNVDYRQHHLYYYGYDHADTTLEINAADIEQRYQNIGAGLNLSNSSANEAQVDYWIGIDFLNTRNLQSLHENSINTRLDISKGIGDNIVLAWKNQIGFSKYNTESPSDFAVNSTPTFSYVADFGKFTIGASALVSEKNFRAFPYIELIGNISDKFSLYGRWNKTIIDNDYHTFARQNPFIDNNISLHNTLNEARIVGVQAKSERLGVRLEGFQRIGQQQALFVNTHTTVERFVAVYDTVKALGAQLELSYDIMKKVHCNLQTTFQKYTTTNETAAWHLPTLQSSLSLHFLPIERLSLGTEIFVYQGMKALLASGNSTTLPAVIDLNLAAKYQIQQHIAVFANGNNLLNRNNGLFYAYPTYKINFLGGILLRF